MIIYLLCLKTYFWLDSNLEKNSHRGQPISPGNLMLALFLWLPWFHIFCSLFLVFLCSLFLRSNFPAFVLQEVWPKVLNLGCFGPGLLTSLFKGFLTTYWPTLNSLEKLKSFQILLALSGPNQWGTVVSVSPSLLLLYVNQVESTLSEI